VAHKDLQITRLIRGIEHKNFVFAHYDSAEDIITKTIEIGSLNISVEDFQQNWRKS